MKSNSKKTSAKVPKQIGWVRLAQYKNGTFQVEGRYVHIFINPCSSFSELWLYTPQRSKVYHIFYQHILYITGRCSR